MGGGRTYRRGRRRDDRDNNSRSLIHGKHGKKIEKSRSILLVDAQVGRRRPAGEAACETEAHETSL